MATDKNTPRRRFRLRLALILVSVLLVFVGLNVLNQAVNTLHELTRVEAERDQWQRPDEVLRVLDLKPGSVVVDMGSGAGYFALKISKAVGAQGRVLAVDLRKLSLAFLWIRSRRQPLHNVSIIVGEPNDPHLETNAVDSVLVANTYHELADSKSILSHLYRSLRPGGRLVVVDRGPGAADLENVSAVSEGHGIPLTVVERELALAGFSILSSNPDFINRPDDHWWLIAAQKLQ